ncbi:Transcriptional regulator, LuxR family [Methylocella tundrae]|nr:Transcriptional regulator, LuxR family [Methylocella tundrae]
MKVFYLNFLQTRSRGGCTFKTDVHHAHAKHRFEKFGDAMTPFAIYLDEIDSECEEKRVLAAFTRRVTEVAILSRSSRSSWNSTDPLNILSQPALLLDLDGFVVEANEAAASLFNNDIRVRQRRLFIRDPEARNRLRIYVDQFEYATAEIAPVVEPIIVPRQDSLPILLRIWPIDGGARWPSADVRALVTLNALGPRPGPPASLLARTFSLTPSEAKLACIIARGAGPDTAAAELNISRETARNQLKSIFAKTATHRQGELVALLLQV